MKNHQRNKFYNWDKLIWYIAIVGLDDPEGKIKEGHGKERIELYVPKYKIFFLFIILYKSLDRARLT